MEINYNNYAEYDEQEIRQDEEKQMKEIQDLIRNELNDIELEEEDEYERKSCDNFENENNILDKSFEEDDSRYEIENSNNDSNDKENNFLKPLNVINNFIPNYNATTPFPQFYNFFPDNQYKFHQTNNNCNGLDESSINWEISLHDEMGVPGTGNSNNAFTVNKPPYLNSAINASKPNQPNEEPSRMKIITRDVAVECIPSNQRELDNLELLYSARGKRIEQLQLELDTERDKRLKETRILNHKVTLLESEQKNESKQLQRAHEELEQHRQTIKHNEDLISKQTIQITQLESDIDMLRENLKSSNIVIEDLNGQLTELSSNSAISRNNQKQTELLDCINRQFDTDSYRLKMEIQRLSERVNEKTKEIENLEAIMDEQVENHRKQKHEWKSDYDRLRDELETEKGVRKSLENSTSQETIDNLEGQIADLNLEKSLVDDVNEYLREQVIELSHQLSIYEQTLAMMDKNDDSMNRSNFSLGHEEERALITGSCPVLSAIREPPMLVNKNRVDSTNLSDLRKQIFVLIGRTTSLTKRLVDIRKTNLDSKGYSKKLEKVIEEEKRTKQTLQMKLSELEKRVKNITNGEETVLETQLKVSVESLEIVKDNLEQQCKVLQNQLKQATDSMKDLDSGYKRLEEEFSEYKEAAEEDKLECIENVKRVCNNHYDKLREQLEQSWRSEKEILVEQDNCHREQLLRELSDALKEIDRVKTLYIQLSQQKSDELQDRTNWNEWIVKKLEDQKRSLNQQFKKDQETVLNEIERKHLTDLELLRAELDKSVMVEDKCEGTVTRTLVSIACSTEHCQLMDKSVQIDGRDQIEELLCLNERLQSALKNQEQCARISQKTNRPCEMKSNIARVNLSPISKTDCSTSMLSSDNRHPKGCSQPSAEPSALPPSIIRSVSPQFFPQSNKPNKTSTEYLDLKMLQIRRSNMHQQFQILKRDLIDQLAGLSDSAQLDHINSPAPAHLREAPSLVNSCSEVTTMDSIKDKLYTFLLEVQVRAAATLQNELEKSQKLVKRSVIDQLRQILPVSLSVDGQLMNINPAKVKTLVNKINLVLDHIEADSSPNHSRNGMSDLSKLCADASPVSSAQRFSHTSTPLKSRRVPQSTAHVDQLTRVTSNASLTSSIDSWNSSLRSQREE